jgi:ATP-dependent helicase/nuclease subunit A
LRTLAARLEETHHLLRAETTWPAGALVPALPVSNGVGARLLALNDWMPYAQDGSADPLVQAVATAQSSARQMVQAGTEEDALAALLGLGRLRAWVDNPGRWKRLPDGRNAGWATRGVLQVANKDVVRVLDAHRSATLASMLALLRDFVLDGVQRRRSDGVATFHDLLAWARDLLRNNREVRHAAQDHYQRIFIDEFQDTDPLQAELAFYLATDERDGLPLPEDWRDARLVPGKLFLVGDPKQSIYRFRGADITIYDDLLERLKDVREHLSHNFRSVRPVIDWVNHHFDRHMQVSPGIQPEYVALAAEWEAHAADARCGVYRVGGLIEGSAGDAAQEEAEAFARVARTAVEDGWQVSDRDGSGKRVLRPATYRDICVLLPARTHLRQLERALEDLDVPYRLEAGKLVLATQEVRDLLACLRAIEDPSDQVALIAALRSPAYACSDLDLLQWVEGGGKLDHECAAVGPDGPVKDALLSMATFHASRHVLSPPALVEAFIGDRLLVAAAFGEAQPREAWRRLRYVVSRARAFTMTGRHTLRAFLDWIEGLQRAEVRDPENGSAESDEDALHIQTIHGAKGLEYPIVLLGGLGAPARGRYSGVDVIADRRTGRLACSAGWGWSTGDYGTALAREQQMADAEAVRLLYVATTRARDHLVLSLFRGDKADGCTASIIERHLADGAPELCGELPIPNVPAQARDPEHAEGEPGDDSLAAADAERAWGARRLERIRTASAPAAHTTWWSVSEEVRSHTDALRILDGATVRRNVLLLALIEGVLIEETADVVYESGDGRIVRLQGPRDSHEQLLRAGRVALALEAATGCLPVAMELVTPDGETLQSADVQRVAAQAREILRGGDDDRFEP